MIDEFWSSVLWGVSLGAVYVAASWIMTRRALKRPVRSAMTAVFGGMLARLFAAAILLVAMLLLLTVDPLALVGSFLACFVVGLVGEVLLLQRIHPSDSGSST